MKYRVGTNECYVWKTRPAECMLVCSDKLAKMIHLIGFKHMTNANEIADAFLKEIYRLRGFSKVVTSDRGTHFVSQVWKASLEFFGT